jgi:hypothetical protein
MYMRRDYNKSDQYYEKRGFTVCGCMGCAPGEPYCPCTMGQLGLPMSKEHVAAIAVSGEQLRKLLESGAFNV